MRVMTLAVTALLAMAVALPAEAAKKRPRVAHLGSYDECHARALKIGLEDGQQGMRAYVRECQTGRPAGGGKTRGQF
jgi:hypothetical protein